MWYRSLGFKLICSVGVIAVLVIGVYASVSIKTERDQLIQEVIRGANLVSETIKRGLREDMLTYQPERLHRAIDAIGTQEGMEKVRIFNSVGQIIYSSDRTEMGKMVDTSAEQCYACHVKEKPFERLATSARSRIFRGSAGHRVLGTINPIYNEPDCAAAPCHVHPKEQKVLGVMDIDMSLAEVDAVIGDNKEKMILFAAVAIISVSLIIGLFIQRFVSRPVNRLLEGTERITAGDLTMPIAAFSADEIGVLTRSFNQMTQRLRSSELELKASEEKYRSLFDNDPNPIFVFDRSTFRILDANVRATETYGYSKEELLRMSFLDLGDPVDVEKIRLSLVEACVVFPKIRHRRKDGRAMAVNIHSCPREHLGREVIIANIADMSERIQAEAQLVQAGKMATLGEMAAGMAHELNQPLNAIRIGCEFFKKMADRGSPLAPQLLSRVSREITVQVERAAAIISHLREFGRKSDAEELEKVDINTPIRNVFTLLGQQLALRQIEVRLDLQDGLPPIPAVANRLEQVFLNLVMNARDAMEEQGAGRERLLRICSFPEGEAVVVAVADTGVGIPEEIRERIFEPFFTTKEVGRGTGLGLSISYGIVKDYGGSIRMESEVGVGTTFTLTFPGAAVRGDSPGRVNEAPSD
jgi:PAS domain S-box-containing protein